VIVNLEHRLCKHCYEDFTAARNLRRYLDNYSSPFPQNDYYLALLSESIVWEKVTAKTLRRFRAVGNFLLGHELLQPLTWEAIEGSLPSLGDEKRYGTKLIRSCLRDLGHLLADRGQLESWADYVSRRRTLQPLDRLPAYFKPDLTRYRDWLVHDRHRPSSIRSSLYSIAYFLSWCFGLGINSLSEINPLTVEGYQQTLYWEWVCKSCGRAAPFEPWQRNLTGGCTSRDCKSAASYERRRRHSQSEKFKSELRKSDSKFERLFSPSTVNRYLQVLSRILSMAYENGIVDSNPMSRVKRLREPEPRQRYLNQYSNDEEERLMKALAAYGEHVVALAELDLEVGMRLGELLNARWADVDKANQFISVIKTKNDKPRLVPLTKKAVAILKRLRQDAPDDELIFESTRTGRKRRQLMVCFEQAVKESGIGDFHFHDLRHAFATRLRAANVHEYDIADLLGHSTTPGETRNTKVTRGYAHGVPQRLRDAVDSLEEGKRLISATPTLRQVARGA
jgi:integrase